MISQIEARNFRCLKYINQPLQPFHVLVGPNASGKTTFLDTISFLGTLVSSGLDAAIGERTQNFLDLLWGRTGTELELAIEAEIPVELREKLTRKDFERVRYEVTLTTDDKTSEVSISAEKVLLKKAELTVGGLRDTFPIFPTLAADRLALQRSKKETRIVISKTPDGKDHFKAEIEENGKVWVPVFKLGLRRSALGNLPEDESRFPIATWLKTLLTEGVQSFALNSLLIRKASPSGQVRGFKPDGSNLPWVIHRLQHSAPDRFSDWIAHLQTALPDIESIRTIEREDDKHRYLMICYRGGLEVPSWMVSDGTLRLLALTLPAYLPDFKGVYLIEEPENGIHPRAVETMFQSLSSVYGAQMLLATHSPVILSMAEAKSVLCFAKTPEGITDIVRGDHHPRLREWRGEMNLGTLFAAGVLG
ncbi:MAG: ATP-binding protein [Acidobacteriota bacterium]|nr:ATP-binding protein [Acidobacteriota bacterium]